MASATSIARWLLDEASSGTSTLAADSQGSNDLTIDWSSGDGNWTSIGAGNGLDFTATTNTANTAVAELEDISTNGDIGSSLDGVSELSFIVRCDIDAAHSNGMRLIAIGTNSGNTDISLVLVPTSPRLRVRWDQESGGDDDEVLYSLSIPSGVVTIGLSIATSEGTGIDRCKVYIDGVLATAAGGVITENSTLGSINSTNRSFTLGNRPSQNRNIDGKIYYAELFTGVLTATQHSDAHTALALDNDANWDVPSVTSTLTGTATATINESDITTGGKTVILTLTGDTFVTGTSSEDGIAGGSDSDKTGANKWDALIKTALDNTDVVLSAGNTVATITLPAFGTYDTDETETITWTIPAASLTTSTSDITAIPTFTIDAVSSGIQIFRRRIEARTA